MANKPLQSIKFPDLTDTYTIPVVDSTLAVSGAAADAKETGDGLADKVDKEPGKGLSTNDYTDEEKTKLGGVETGANKTVIDTTLTQIGQAADAKAVGDAIANEDKKALAAFATDTASGAVANFPDGADNIPMKDVLVHIEPVQDLHGYDSPWPAGGWKNLFDISTCNGNDSGISYSENGKTITWSGTATSNGWKTISSFHLPVGTYHLHLEGDGYWLEGFNRKENDITITVSDESIVYRLAMVSAVLGETYSGTITNIQIEQGTTYSGYAPYSNICPITGWTGAKVTRTGKNLADTKNLDVTVAGIHCVSDSDGVISLSGTRDSSTGWQILTVFTDFAPGNYVFSSNNQHVTCLLNYTRKPGAFTVAEGDVVRIALFNTVAGDTLNDTGIKVQIESGSTATPYEPYSGQTYDITFPSEAGTVYGGTLDVTSGVLTVTDAQIASYAGETLPGEWISDRDVYVAGTTPTTGAQVVYKLATPITYTLTPQEITSLLGTNNLWADTGNTEVEYRASTKMYIDKKITEAVSALS